MAGRNNLPTDGNNHAVQCTKPIGTTAIAYDSGVTFWFGGTDIFRLCSTTACYVAFDNTVHSGSLYLPAESAEYFHVSSMTRLEVMKVSSIGNLNIVQMDY
jgi:hypothetical protein